jgi:uncharacterized repeat protein (TIGR03803 family)
LIDVNGTLYGTTFVGGSDNSTCTVHEICGTVYSITTTGIEKVIYRFAGGSDGSQPMADLIDVNGTLYGTTTTGGGVGSCYYYNGCGTVYSLTTAGAETVLHRFIGGTDGFTPTALLPNANGTIYGTTIYGGDRDKRGNPFGWGTIFTLTP